VYRIYATFTEGADRLTSCGAWPQKPMTLFTVGCEPGVFYQAPGGTNRAPLAEDILFNPDLEWDTFFTIGVSVNDQGVPYDQTQLSIGFPNFTSVQTFTTTGFVWASPNTPQTRADFAGDGDPALRVLMMQLTVGPDAEPRGFDISLEWRSPTGQSHTFLAMHLGPIEPPGRCCVPEGYCITTLESACQNLWNGLFIPNCGPCDACELTCLPDNWPHPGDGVVDSQDLLSVIANWGSQPILKVPADVSPPHGNWQVNVEDLLVVIAGWGPCPQRK